MNKLIYLSTGQQAELISGLPNNQYLVDPIVSYQNEHTGEWFDLPSSGLIKVDKVFEKPPVDKITDEVKELNLKIEAAQKELKLIFDERSKINRDIATLKNQKTDIHKWQIDMKQFRDCKMFAFFVKDIITPVVIGDPKKIFGGRAFKINWSVDMMNGKTQNWVSSCEMNTDYYSENTTHKLDEDYPFMFDISDDELAQIAKDRSDKMDLSKLHYYSKNKSIPEQFKTERVKKYFEDEAIANKTKWVEDTKDKIAKLQKELNEAIS